MNLLLDTHAFLWFLADDNRMSTSANAAICSGKYCCWVSMASAWEIAVKQSLGKLVFPEPFKDNFLAGCHTNGFQLLEIQLTHIDRTRSLPFHHRDPFDRLLVAQALEEECCLVTRDSSLTDYGVAHLW